MLSYTLIDPIIKRWVHKHSISLSTEGIGGEVRNVYVSSLAGECFQIWVEPPLDGQVKLHAAYVEGPREIEPAKDWTVAISDLSATLEEAFDTVQMWMEPSKRFVPKT